MPLVPASRENVATPTIARTDILLSRGKTAAREGRWTDAITILTRLLSHDPTQRDALNELAMVHANIGDTPAALRCLENSLKIEPAQPAMWQAMATLYLRIGEHDKALAGFDRWILLRPDLIQAKAVRADTLNYLGRYEEAAAAFQNLAAINPSYACGLGVALTWCGRYQEAQEAFDQAIPRPDIGSSALMNKATLLLRMGDFPAGLPLYEARRDLLQPRPKPKSDRPLWLGETSLTGKRLLIHAEQGFGDALQFCRYATLAADAGATVILSARQPLLRLFSTLKGVTHLVADGDIVPDHDLQCPMMSLPLAFGTTLDSIPSRVPYLRADPSPWRDRLKHIPGKKIGLVWAGEARLGHTEAMATDKRRSIPLSALAPLASVPDCAFFSLQIGPAASQTSRPPQGMTIRDLTGELRDFADTAALIECLDLIITVDTAAVHLAGALGKPTYLLNRYDTCWRWLLNRTDSLWYPTLRIFRQPTPHDWTTPIHAATQALRAFAAS